VFAGHAGRGGGAHPMQPRIASPQPSHASGHCLRPAVATSDAHSQSSGAVQPSGCAFNQVQSVAAAGPAEQPGGAGPATGDCNTQRGLSRSVLSCTARRSLRERATLGAALVR
jgi:hypothetical protein